MLTLLTLALLQSDTKTAPVKRGDLDVTLSLTGALEPEAAHEIKLRFEAYMGRMKVQEVAAPGARVNKGDVLLKIDSEVGLQLRDAKLALEDARDGLKAAQDDEKFGAEREALEKASSERNLTYTRDALKYFDEVRGKRMLQQADLSLKSDQDSVADQEEELRQLEKMYKSEELTSDTAEIVVRRARRQLERMRVYLEFQKEDSRYTKEVEHSRQRTGLEHAVKEVENANAAMLARHGLDRARRKRAIERAEAGVKQAEKQVARLEADAARMTVTAPAAGTVYYGGYAGGAWGQAEDFKKSLRPGEPAMVEMVLMTVVEPGKLRVRVDLAESDALDVTAGLKAKVTPTALPAGIDGTTQAPELNVLRISLGSPDPRLRPGHTCTVSLPLGTHTNVLLVPTGAITDNAVTVHKDGTTSKRKIVKGKSNGDHTEVLEGLSEGELVQIP